MEGKVILMYRVSWLMEHNYTYILLSTYGDATHRDG